MYKKSQYGAMLENFQNVDLFIINLYILDMLHTGNF